MAHGAWQCDRPPGFHPSDAADGSGSQAVVWQSCGQLLCEPADVRWPDVAPCTLAALLQTPGVAAQKTRAGQPSPQRSRSVAIIDAVLSLGRALDLDVVAEGVETDGQRQVLIAMGCEYGQGYYFGRPAPVEHWTGNSN